MIHFGLQFPQVRSSYEKVRDLFVESERLGFDSAWLVDHFYSGTSFTNPLLECFTTLAALARDTEALRIGPLVACNSYRHPPLLAKMFSTLDVISGGRMEFGLGAGWYREEYVSYGIPFPPLSVRVEQMREAFQLIKRLWTDDQVSYQGKFYSVTDAYCYPKPVQKPHPPIWIGGKGEKTLRIAAEYADYINLYFTDPQEFREKVNTIESYCDAVGRNPDEITYTWHGPIYMSDKRKEVKEVFKKRMSATKQPLVIGMSLDEYLNRSLAGTPEDCLQRIHEYVDVGARYIVPSMWQTDEPEFLEKICVEIMKPLKKDS